MQSFNVEKFRTQFPLLKNKLNNSELIYFDNAATTQKPQCVIDKYQEYYQEYNANVHRASHQLSSISTSAFENARGSVQQFINARYIEEIIWTKGTTESINLLANSLGDLVINSGDEIILSQSEHHANIVPWQIIAEKKSAIIKVVPLTKTGIIDTKALKSLISPKTKVVSFAHISNVIGKINPINDIIELCKKNNIISIVDGAQAIAHEMVDVQALDCDFYVFSAHKMYGPTGVGVLYGKRALLEKMPPYQGGGEMISSVSFSKTTYNTLPFKFEAGTPNIAGVIAFATAINFILTQSMKAIIEYENSLLNYCYGKLQAIDSVSFITDEAPSIPLFSFTVAHHHNHDVASFLDANNIAVRSGHHCAMPLMEYLQYEGCIRIALTAYNTFEEVDQFINTIKELINASEQEKIAGVDNSHVIYGNAINSVMDSQTIIDKFSRLKGWDSRHREIMLLGKAHSRLPEEQLTDTHLVQGCESKAWLIHTVEQGIYQFYADSDAKVIRGLLTIILAAYNNKTVENILAFDIDSYFDELGLIQHLSPSRANGLIAIVDKIKSTVSS
ncbi:SufS family cysteine desulfurase [Colwellia sp. RE-S-Sl-9]